MALERSRALLTTRYGPLPGYGWIVVIAGGTFLYVRHRNKAATSSTSTTADTTSADQAASTPVNDYGPGADSYGAGDFLPPGLGAVVANPAPVAPAPTPPRATGPNGTTSHRKHAYVVRRGDTLTSIARQFHTTAAAIEKLNPAIKRNPTHRIAVGETLVIP